MELHAHPKAWMSRELMLKWISNVLEPHCMKFKRSLIIMDRFKVHLMPEVTKKLNEINADIILIPPGLTYMLQPLDIYVNKPIKDALRDKFETFITKDILEVTKSSNFSLFQI
jgi:hypothetical protein